MALLQRPLSLRVRATLLVCCIMALALGLAAGSSIYLSNRLIAADQQRTADAIATSLAGACELALAVQDTDELNRLSHSFLYDRNILFVGIFDASQRLSASAAQSDEAWKGYRSGEAESDRYYKAERDVLVAPRKNEFGPI